MILFFQYNIGGKNMSDDKNEINVLDELNKGACMGMDAIHFILDKVKDNKLHKLLEKQYKEYKNIAEEICKLYPNYSDKKPHETSTMNKFMTWAGVEMKTMNDANDSKITELLLQGTNMGIIEGRRLLNHKNTDDRVHHLVSKYVNMQEEIVENLKKFL